MLITNVWDEVNSYNLQKVHTLNSYKGKKYIYSFKKKYSFTTARVILKSSFLALSPQTSWFSTASLYKENAFLISSSPVYFGTSVDSVLIDPTDKDQSW